MKVKDWDHADCRINKSTLARLQKVTVMLNAPVIDGFLMDDVHYSLRKQACSWIEK